MGHADAAPAGQHADADCWRGHWGDLAWGQPGVADQPLRVPRQALAGLGADAAVCDSGLCAGVCLCRPAGLRRAGANPVTRMVWHGLAAASGTLHRRRDHRVDSGVLPLRVPAGAHRLFGPGQRPDGSRPHSGAKPVAGVLAGRLAHGAPGHWRRCGVGADGNSGRFWRRLGVQLRHLYHRDLQNLVRLFQPVDRRPTGQPVAAGGDGGALR